MAVLPIGVQGPGGGGCESQAQDLSDQRHRSRAHAIACFSGQLLAHGLFGALLAAPLYEPLTALTGSLPALIASLGGLLMLARTLQQTASDERTTQGVAPMLVAGLSYQLVAMQWLTSILKPGLDGRLLALAAALLLLQVLPQIGLWMVLQASARRLQRRGWLAERWAPSLSWPLAWLGWTPLKEPLWIGGQYGALALGTLDWPVAQTLLPWCGGPMWEALLWGAAIGFWQLGRWRARLLVLLAMALPWRTPLAVADRGDARPVRLVAVQAGADKDWDLASRDAALAQLHAASRAHPPGTILVTSEVFLKETPPQPPIGVWADFVRALTEAGQHALISPP